MATETQPIHGAQTEEQKNFSALDSIVSETERAARERLILRKAELDFKQRLAKAFAKSGCFADVKGLSEEEAIARALVKIELGESMGFSPAESMTGIDIIQGRVAVGANLRAARMAVAGYAWPQMILTNEGCWLPLTHKAHPVMAAKVDGAGNVVTGADGLPVMEQVVISFTKADAQLAGLLGKDNWRKNPRNMYFSRAVTNAQRWYAPHVLKADVLSTEEAMDLAPIADAAPIRAAISLDSFKPSTDTNRGHEGANPEEPTEQRSLLE